MLGGEYGRAWSVLRKVRARRHALDGLLDWEPIDPERAQASLAAHPDPSVQGSVAALSSAVAAAGRLLRGLFARRARADYSTDPVSDGHGRQAVADATRVVASVQAWLASRVDRG